MTKAEKEKRIYRAITGFRIPLMTVPPLYKKLQALVEAGAADETLKETVAGFPGVEGA